MGIRPWLALPCAGDYLHCAGVQITNVEKSVPQDNEVLIKVRAASINPLDGGSLKGVPYVFRIVCWGHRQGPLPSIWQKNTLEEK